MLKFQCSHCGQLSNTWQQAKDHHGFHEAPGVCKKTVEQCYGGQRDVINYLRSK